MGKNNKRTRQSSTVPEAKHVENINNADNQLQKYAINTSLVKVDEEELIKNGYRKIPKASLSRLSLMLQQAPGMVANEITRSAAKATADKVLVDAYRAVIPDGMHLAKKKTVENAFIGGYLNNQTNQVSGQATLFKIDPIEISRTPQYVLGFFNAMSVVTGQYYLSEINHDLNNIKNSVDSIQTYLAENKKSKILAADQVLNNTFENLQFIKNNEWQRLANLGEIKRIKTQALADFIFYGEQLTKDLSDFSPKEKPDIIKEKVKNIGASLPLRWCALMVYAKAEMLEVLLSEIDDIEYLENTSKKIKSCRDAYNEQYLQLKNVLNQSAKQGSTTEKVASLGYISAYLLSDNILTMPVAGIVGVGATLLDGGKMDKRIRIKKEIDEFMKACGNLKTVNSIHSNLIEYSKLQNNPLEILETDNATYIKTYDSKDEIEEFDE